MGLKAWTLSRMSWSRELQKGEKKGLRMRPIILILLFLFLQVASRVCLLPSQCRSQPSPLAQPWTAYGRINLREVRIVSGLRGGLGLGGLVDRMSKSTDVFEMG